MAATVRVRVLRRISPAIDQAVAQAAEMDTNLCYRWRLRTWLACIRAGEAISMAAYQDLLLRILKNFEVHQKKPLPPRPFKPHGPVA